MAGNLEDFAQSHGIIPINFLVMDRTSCTVLEMKISLRYIDGRVKATSICMQMTNQLDLPEVRLKEDLHFI